MRTKLLAIVLFTVCLALAGRSTATPRVSSPSAELTPQPARYLPAVMKDATIGQIAPTPTVTPPISATVGISGEVYLNPRWIVTQAGAPQPVQHLILKDVTGSMSWDFNGYGTVVCIPAGGNQWVNTVDAAHLPDPSVFPNLSDTVVGYTYIYHVNSATPLFTLPIQRDPATDKISFLLPPPDQAHPNAGIIAPGTYEMMAYVGYKGNDQISRQYDYFINPSSLQAASRIVFTLTTSGLGGQIIPLEPLFLDLAPAAHICP